MKHLTVSDLSYHRKKLQKGIERAHRYYSGRERSERQTPIMNVRSLRNCDMFEGEDNSIFMNEVPATHQECRRLNLFLWLRQLVAVRGLLALISRAMNANKSLEMQETM